MINLIITIFGALLIVAGIYAMTFGFGTPPNFLFFFLGLCAAVLGFMLLIIFGSNVNLSQLKVPKSAKTDKKSVKKVARKSSKSAERVKEEIQAKNKVKARIKEKEEVKTKIKEQIKTETAVKEKVPKMDKKSVKPESVKLPEQVKEKPKKKPLIDLSRLRGSKKPEDVKKESDKKPVRKEMEPVQVGDKPVKEEVKPAKAEDKSDAKKVEPVKVGEKSFVKEVKATKAEDKSTTATDKPKTSKKPKIVPGQKLKPITPVPKDTDKDDEHYVKERLDKLKQNYIENVNDVEDLIEERLESFRGTLNKIKSESKEPNIIWSFDAADVQDAMKETILKAENKIIMMYPWVRNIDVGILKKFMDTESKMIIQEASLDDDASVELIKVLQENNVKIRTMPHVHTVAVVSDDTNGLIISTDPIYESFEVGVIYKDKNSISEIEKLFGEAWELSTDVTLEETT